MKKFIIISLLLHSTFLLFNPIEQTEPTVYEIEMVDNDSNSGTEKTDKKESVTKILEVGGEGDKVSTDHYYGVGIYSQEHLQEIPGYGIIQVVEITDVVIGYCGEEAGLRVGDMIVLVNGIEQSPENNIKGDGPKLLNLSIFRNGVTILISINRCKVYL